jgi:hypothetical protein
LRSLHIFQGTKSVRGADALWFAVDAPNILCHQDVIESSAKAWRSRAWWLIQSLMNLKAYDEATLNKNMFRRIPYPLQRGANFAIWQSTISYSDFSFPTFQATTKEAFMYTSILRYFTCIPTTSVL